MRGMLQIVCVVALALGAGLFATGRGLQPRQDLSEPLAAVLTTPREYEEQRAAAATYRGCGVGFMVLGALGLAVPWLNSLVSRRSNPTSSPSSPAPTNGG